MPEKTIKNPSSLANQLKREIKTLMDNTGLSVMNIAEISGVSYSTIHRMLEGTALPSLSKLEKLAASLDKELVIYFIDANKSKSKPNKSRETLESMRKHIDELLAAEIEGRKDSDSNQKKGEDK